MKLTEKCDAIEYCIDNAILPEFFTKNKEIIEEDEMLDLTFERQIELAAQEAKEEGREEGIAKGRMSQLIELVHDGLLKVTDAAEKAGMTEAEFRKYI